MRSFSKIENEESLIGFKVKIFPTEEQVADINYRMDICRGVYNLALEIENKAYEEDDDHLRFFDLINYFNKIKKEDQYSWICDISSGSLYGILRDVDNAFEFFFSKKCRYPKFKSKKNAKRSLPIRPDRTYIRGRDIQISGLNDRLVLAKDHKIPNGSKLYQTRITFDGDNYWFSGMYENYEKTHIITETDNRSEPIGIDVGVVNMITTSDGEFYKYSDTSFFEKRYKHLQRRFDRYKRTYLDISKSTRVKYEDIPKSKNYMKLCKQMRKTVRKINNKINYDINCATKAIVDKNPEAIVIETISVKDMIKTNDMAKYAPYMRFYEIHRQIQYKARWRGIPVIKADPYFPSSKLCSNCGAIGSIGSNRIFHCSACGYKEDRDLNASYNLRNLAY